MHISEDQARDAELQEVNGSKQNAPPRVENSLGTNENAEKHIAKSSALDAIGQYDVTSPGSPSDEDTPNDVTESLPQSHSENTLATGSSTISQNEKTEGLSIESHAKEKDDTSKEPIKKDDDRTESIKPANQTAIADPEEMEIETKTDPCEDNLESGEKMAEVKIAETISNEERRLACLNPEVKDIVDEKYLKNNQDDTKSQIKDEKEEYFMEDDTENNGDEKEENEDELKREPSLSNYDEVGFE